MRYVVNTWTNLGNRITYETDDLADALAWAKGQRSVHNRTVKVGRCDNTIHHWTRAQHAKRNHWSVRATADEWFP